MVVADKEKKLLNQLLADFILGDLLYGKETTSELISQYFTPGQYRSFNVLVSLCPALSAAQSHQLSDLISKKSGDTIYITSVPSHPHIVIVCLSETTINSDVLTGIVSAAFAEVCGKDYPLYMGTTVTDIYSLHTSYRSAVTAYWETTQDVPGTNAKEFSAKLQELSQSIYAGDEVEAQHRLEDIQHFLCTQIIGEGHRRYYCFELLHAYLAVVNNSFSHLSSQEIELLLSFNGMEHLFMLLRESIHQTCAQVADMEQPVNLHLQQQLLQYVDEHYTNSDLSLYMVANHIGVSIYAVSRLFKEATGKGFKDYVKEKRLEYGHKLLMSTQKSIVEISTESGFESSSYFTIVFKKKYGMPPTTYRLMQKED